MNNKQRVLAILNSVKPTNKNWEINDIIDGGYIDSFELMHLISSLCEDFGVKIEVDDIIPENFNSVDSIVNMIQRLTN